MFEPNRFAQNHLQDAYTHLVPIVHRRLEQTQPKNDSGQSREERNIQ